MENDQPIGANANQQSEAPVQPEQNEQNEAENATDEKDWHGEIELLKRENEQLKDSWKRTAADFENFKKRKQQESQELFELAKEMALTKLIPPLQSLEQVLKYAPEDDKYKDWIKGLDATIMQLEKAMEELGLKKIAAVGSKFDPLVHEAIEEVEGEEPNKIVKELRPGFTLNGRVVIPAKVAVGKSESNMESNKEK
jgi:molecular chaperone GrpE